MDMATARRVASLVLSVCVALLAVKCREATAPKSGSRFRVVDTGNQTFRFATGTAAVIAKGDSLARSQAQTIIVGVPLAGDGGYNSPWHWHLDSTSVGFAEAVIEICETTAEGVEQDLNGWLSYGHVCILGTVQGRE